MTPDTTEKITLATLRDFRRTQRRFAMLTAYDFPTAAAAQAAGVHALLVGDSMGTVLLGHPNTRTVPLELMLILAQAVRRAAPRTYLIGDLPFESISRGPDAVLRASQRFRDECGCDGIKIEVARDERALVACLARAGFEVTAHLGLRPQTVLLPDGYRAQARDPDSIDELVADARIMVDAGAAMLLLEAVPTEASAAVSSACDVPLVGCGAGDACDGHVVVTQDMLGLGGIRPPRFVPVLADLGTQMQSAMSQFVEDVVQRRYPRPEHMYPLRKNADGSLTT